MAFKHPLARDAKVWSTGGTKGKPQQILVIITTLVLDETHKKFKADKVKTLSEAARSWLKDNGSQATDFLLMSRPKDWAAEGE